MGTDVSDFVAELDLGENKFGSDPSESRCLEMSHLALHGFPGRNYQAAHFGIGPALPTPWSPLVSSMPMRYNVS